MADEITEIAPAGIADQLSSETPVGDTLVQAEAAPLAAETVPAVTADLAEPATAELATAEPKRKPGRPRKAVSPDAARDFVPPVMEAKTKPAKITTAKTKPDQAAVEVKPVLVAKPAARKLVKATKTATAKVPAVVITARKTASAFPQSMAPKTKDLFIMTANTTEMTETIQTAMKDAAAKAKSALEKSQAAMGEMGTFTKGNVEAVVETGKILATGLQEMGKSYAADTKSVVETMAAEIKDLASAKSPTEFFEKQSAMLRKQFDAAVAASSKNSEAMLKLASEAFQPISNRVSLAVEKMKQAA